MKFRVDSIRELDKFIAALTPSSLPLLLLLPLLVPVLCTREEKKLFRRFRSRKIEDF